MSTVQPPPSSPVPTGAPAPASLPVLTVSAPPPALTALPLGNPLNALVLTGTTQGQAQIETPAGTFLVNTNLPLKANQPLILQVGQAQGSGVLNLNVLEINGKPVTSSPLTAQGKPLGGGIASSLAGTGGPAGNTPTTAVSSVNLLVGSSFTATTLTPISATLVLATPAPSSTASPAVTGTPQSPVATAAATPKAGTPLPTGAIQSPSPSPGMSTMAPSVPGIGAGQPTGTETRLFPAGGQFSLTIEGIRPPPPPGTPPTPLASTGSVLSPEAIVLGRVSAHTPSGQPIIQSAHGSFALNTAQPLPTGTELTIRIDTLPEAGQTTNTMSPALQRTGMIMAGSWPSLEEGFNVIQSADPGLAQQVQAVAVPKADIKLAATTLFFLSALRAGDLRGWMGDNATRLLGKVRPDVLQRLGNDFRLLGESTEEGAGPRRATEWRGTMIPFMNGEAIEQIRLFTRQIGEEDTENEVEEAGTRFLVDITLSNIGRFQLDGMVATKDKRLDMIVRTAAALPDQVRADIMRLFEGANDVVGMRGGMTFQASPNGFVEPLDEAQPVTGEGVGIIV